MQHRQTQHNKETEMKPLTTKERAELKRLTRKIRSSRATIREFNRAFSLTNRDHAEVKLNQKTTA